MKVYDSLNLRLSPTIVKVIAEFLHTSNDFFTIEHARMQCQTGSDDCGLFAIASACALWYEHDPSLAKFDQPQMRPHLCNAFETKNLVPFPTSTGSPSLTLKHKKRQKIKVYCSCRVPDDGQKMIQCSSCGRWYHASCIRVLPRLAMKKASVKWNCEHC